MANVLTEKKIIPGGICLKYKKLKEVILSNNVLLIGGTGRSGTTILNRIFSNHPDVTDVPEWRFLIDPDGIVDFYHNAMIWSPYHYNIKLIRLEKLLSSLSNQNIFISYYSKLVAKLKFDHMFPFKVTPRYSGVQIKKYCTNFDKLTHELLFNLKQFTFNGSWVGLPIWYPCNMAYNYFGKKEYLAKILSNFLYSVVDSVLEKQNCSYYLEKNTWNVLWLDTIIELLPCAKLVHIYRDPRDVVSSFSKQSWMPSNPVECAVIYRDLMNRWYTVRNTISKDSFLEISLENLVKEPENVLSIICRFWNIPWSDKLLDVKLNRANSGRWREDLSVVQQKEIHDILQNILKKQGYFVE